MQVYLVAGGKRQVGGSSFLASTEIYFASHGQWRYVEPLPVPVVGAAGITISNIVYMTGKY